jgi:hypothetical protein
MKSFDVPAGHPTPLPSRESFMKTFLSATGDPDPTAQTRLSSSMGFRAAASILYEDNNACIAMAMVQKPTPRMRHMDTKFHALVEWVDHDLLCLERIDTSLNIADHFTKQLGRTLFHRHVDYILGKVPPPYSSVFARFRSALHQPQLSVPFSSAADLPTTFSKLPRQFAAVAAHLCATCSYILGSTFWGELGFL